MTDKARHTSCKKEAKQYNASHFQYYCRLLLHLRPTSSSIKAYSISFYNKKYLPSNLLTYMGVFDLVKTRAFCLDGISDHCIFMSPLLLLFKGKVITSSFFYTCLPLGVGVKNVKGIKGVKWIFLSACPME